MYIRAVSLPPDIHLYTLFCELTFGMLPRFSEQLWLEWIDNLALRRVFYLEHDHWKERSEELTYLSSLPEEEEPLQANRPSWVPHPEICDTVPNIAIYSVLFRLPHTLQPDPDDIEACQNRLEWQLNETTKFFDKCVPSQPGFSSSVAAATILPDATKLSHAWQKWYKAASKMRKLCFIKRIIEERKRETSQATSSDEFMRGRRVWRDIRKRRVPEGKNAEETEIVFCRDEDIEEAELAIPNTIEASVYSAKPVDVSEFKKFSGNGQDSLNPDQYSFRNFDKSKLGFSRIVGLALDEDAEDDLGAFMLNFGVEQTGAYSREFAKR